MKVSIREFNALLREEDILNKCLWFLDEDAKEHIKKLIAAREDVRKKLKEARNEM